jgi:thymidylate synthase
MKRKLIKWVFELVWCIGDKEAQIRFGFPFNIASYATLAKILEEITLFGLRVEGNLKCVHFYDNQFEAVETLLKRDTDVHEDCTLEVSQEFKDLCQLFRENQNRRII